MHYQTVGTNFDFLNFLSDVTSAAFSIIAVAAIILSAGSLPVLSFDNGYGEFGIFSNGVVFSEGIAAIGNLDFEVGLVGINGDVSMALNTTGAAVDLTPEFSIDLPAGDYLELCVDGSILLGPAAIPAEFAASDAELEVAASLPGTEAAAESVVPKQP